MIDPVSMSAVTWGGDPLFIAMRAENPSQIFGQATDYGAMFHNQYIAMKGSGPVLDPAKSAVITGFNGGNVKKIELRGLLKDVWILSLRELFILLFRYFVILLFRYFVTNSTCTGEALPKKDIKRMQWGRAFADFCYKQQVKLVNYPFGVKPMGTPGGIIGASNLPLKNVKEIVGKYVQFWKQQARELKAQGAHKGDDKPHSNGDDDDDSEEEVFEDDLVRFIPWEEGKLSVACSAC